VCLPPPLHWWRPDRDPPCGRDPRHRPAGASGNARAGRPTGGTGVHRSPERPLAAPRVGLGDGPPPRRVGSGGRVPATLTLTRRDHTPDRASGAHGRSPQTLLWPLAGAEGRRQRPCRVPRLDLGGGAAAGGAPSAAEASTRCPRRCHRRGGAPQRPWHARRGCRASGGDRRSEIPLGWGDWRWPAPRASTARVH